MGWFSQSWGWLLGGAVASLALSIGGLWAARWFVVMLPVDYFVRETEPARPGGGRHPLARWSWLVLKNMLGLVLIVAGVGMLIAPGPGVLAILIGLCLLDPPGKRALTRRLLGGRQALGQLNALRARAGKPPLAAPGPLESIDR